MQNPQLDFYKLNYDYYVLVQAYSGYINWNILCTVEISSIVWFSVNGQLTHGWIESIPGNPVVLALNKALCANLDKFPNLSEPQFPNM